MSIVACHICKKNFHVKPSHQILGWGKYCSTSCRSKSQLKGKIVKCLICKTIIYRSPAKIKSSKSGCFFCNKSCQTKWRNSYFSEEKHPNWKQGVRSYRKILLRENSDYSCLGCKSQDKRVLIVHHVDHNRKNNNVLNLVWMCLNCHHLVHNHNEYKDELDIIKQKKLGACSSVG